MSSAVAIPEGIRPSVESSVESLPRGAWPSCVISRECLLDDAQSMRIIYSVMEAGRVSRLLVCSVRTWHPAWLVPVGHAINRPDQNVNRDVSLEEAVELEGGGELHFVENNWRTPDPTWSTICVLGFTLSPQILWCGSELRDDLFRRYLRLTEPRPALIGRNRCAVGRDCTCGRELGGVSCLEQLSLLRSCGDGSRRWKGKRDRWMLLLVACVSIPRSVKPSLLGVCLGHGSPARTWTLRRSSDSYNASRLKYLWREIRF